jgi:anti-sigma B factor antagonist
LTLSDLNKSRARPTHELIKFSYIYHFFSIDKSNFKKMNINVLQKEGYTLVIIQGRLDTITAGDFENKIMEILGGGVTKLLLDCSNLTYISSSGLRVFLVAQKKMLATGGILRICCLKPEIKNIFDISGFSVIFSIFSDVEKAISD